MKKILHSGEFLDYDGNTIKVTFYKEKHLWVSRSSITAPYTGGEYEVEVWSDAGDALIYDSPVDWIDDPIFQGSYKNGDGHTVYKYKMKIAGRPFVGVTQTATFNVGVEITDSETLNELNEYDDTILTKTITITRR